MHRKDNLFCWLCKAPIEKIGFRTVCTCGACLHACKGCRYYQIGLPNDCKILNTETVRDREGNNFCEEFAPLQYPQHKESIQESKQKFEDLFR